MFRLGPNAKPLQWKVDRGRFASAPGWISEIVLYPYKCGCPAVPLQRRWREL